MPWPAVPLAGTLLLTLKREVPIGSIVLPPGGVRVYALRPGRSLPARFDAHTLQTPSDVGGTGLDGDGQDDLLNDLGDGDLRYPEDTWLALSGPPDAPRPHVAVPEAGIKTAALVFTGPNLRRLPYAMALDRRYRDVASQARLVALEGEATPQGGWRTSRAGKAPISLADPAVAALVWDTPTAMRGYLLIGPMAWAGLAVDLWNGPDDAVIAPAALAADEHWRQIQVHHQTRNHVKYNWHTPMTLRGDFGDVVAARALRVRVIEHPAAPAAPPMPGEGGFEGLLVFQPLGKDTDLPEALAQRLTVLNLPALDAPRPEATLRAHLPLDRPGALAFAADGVLYAACAHGVVRIASVEAQTPPLRYTVAVPRAAYRHARALAVGPDNHLYLLDGEQRQVLVFDLASGQELRRIGKPGGQLGRFDPESFTQPSAMAIDSRGKLWVVEQHFQPKRISRWSCDGRFEKDFMGPTHYGGGGVMDPGDRSVINHLGMKFRFNWQDRSWKLESRLCSYDGNIRAPDRVLYAHARRYLTSPAGGWLSFGGGGPIVALCEELDGVAVPLVEVGLLEPWTAFQRNRDIQQAFRDLKPGATLFVWSDHDRDGEAQVAEIQPVRGLEYRGGVHIGDDLSLNFQGYRLRVAAVGENGVPRYDVTALERVPALQGDLMVDGAGRTFVMGHTFLDPGGGALWHYPDAYASVQRSMRTPWGFYDRPAGVLCGSIHLLGHFEIGDEHLYCVGGNNGDYYAFTGDGFLAAAILGGPAGYGRRFFSMADCRPGITDLSGLRKTVEDFHGHITRAEDGKVYAIAGKNHISIIRIDGLEAMRRAEGRLAVTAEEAARTERWVAERAACERRRRRPSLTRPAFARTPIRIDGQTVTDWPDTETLILYERRSEQGLLQEQATAKLAFDGTHLYVAARATDDTAMRNSAADAARVFQHGDALDLHIGLDPAADPARLDTVPGDVRLLLTELAGAPTAVLLRYQASQDSPRAGEPRTYTSPMGSLAVADVGVLKDARMVIRREGAAWVLEAAIPWQALGAPPPEGRRRLRGDIGVLFSDPEGMATVARHYWANRANVVLGDLPAEARVQPALWGEWVFEMPDPVERALDLIQDAPDGPDAPGLPEF